MCISLKEWLGGWDINIELLHEFLVGYHIEEIDNLLQVNWSVLMRETLDLLVLVIELVILSGLRISNNQEVLSDLDCLGHIYGENRDLFVSPLVARHAVVVDTSAALHGV